MKRHMIQRPTFWLVVVVILMVVNTHDLIGAIIRGDKLMMVITGLGVIGGVFTVFQFGREFFFWLLMKLYRKRLIIALEKEISAIEERLANARKAAAQKKEETPDENSKG